MNKHLSLGGGALNLSSQASFSTRHSECYMRYAELDSESINAHYSPSSVLRPPSPTTGEKGKGSSRHPELVSGSQRASSAFTLAEVLITLGIIGVVAAITIPSLIMGKERKELQAGLKKNYSVLSQSLVMASNEAGE